MTGRAVRRGLVHIKVQNLRDYSLDKKRHRARPTVRSLGRVDNRPYGGGPGMVFEALPIVKAVEKIRGQGKIKNQKTKVLILSFGGKQFTNAFASRLAKNYDHLILIAGRYEGIDARVRRLIAGAEEISIGPYVLTGGELPAMVIVDAVTRQVPGVLGDDESLEEKRVASRDVYTRPEVITYRGRHFRVPKVLLSGHHARIDQWRSNK